MGATGATGDVPKQDLPASTVAGMPEVPGVPQRVHLAIRACVVCGIEFQISQR